MSEISLFPVLRPTTEQSVFTALRPLSAAAVALSLSNGLYHLLDSLNHQLKYLLLLSFGPSEQHYEVVKTCEGFHHYPWME